MTAIECQNTDVLFAGSRPLRFPSLIKEPNSLLPSLTALGDDCDEVGQTQARGSETRLGTADGGVFALEWARKATVSRFGYFVSMTSEEVQ